MKDYMILSFPQNSLKNQKFSKYHYDFKFSDYDHVKINEPAYTGKLMENI